MDEKRSTSKKAAKAAKRSKKTSTPVGENVPNLLSGSSVEDSLVWNLLYFINGKELLQIISSFGRYIPVNKERMQQKGGTRLLALMLPEHTDAEDNDKSQRKDPPRNIKLAYAVLVLLLKSESCLQLETFDVKEFLGESGKKWNPCKGTFDGIEPRYHIKDGEDNSDDLLILKGTKAMITFLCTGMLDRQSFQDDSVYVKEGLEDRERKGILEKAAALLWQKADSLLGAVTTGRPNGYNPVSLVAEIFSPPKRTKQKKDKPDKDDACEKPESEGDNNPTGDPPAGAPLEAQEQHPSASKEAEEGSSDPPSALDASPAGASQEQQEGHLSDSVEADKGGCRDQPSVSGASLAGTSQEKSQEVQGERNEAADDLQDDDDIDDHDLQEGEAEEADDDDDDDDVQEEEEEDSPTHRKGRKGDSRATSMEKDIGGGRELTTKTPKKNISPAKTPETETTTPPQHFSPSSKSSHDSYQPIDNNLEFETDDDDFPLCGGEDDDDDDVDEHKHSRTKEMENSNSKSAMSAQVIFVQMPETVNQNHHHSRPSIALHQNLHKKHHHSGPAIACAKKSFTGHRSDASDVTVKSNYQEVSNHHLLLACKCQIMQMAGHSHGLIPEEDIGEEFHRYSSELAKEQRKVLEAKIKVFTEAAPALLKLCLQGLSPESLVAGMKHAMKNKENLQDEKRRAKTEFWLPSLDDFVLRGGDTTPPSKSKITVATEAELQDLKSELHYRMARSTAHWDYITKTAENMAIEETKMAKAMEELREQYPILFKNEPTEEEKLKLEEPFPPSARLAQEKYKAELDAMSPSRTVTTPLPKNVPAKPGVAQKNILQQDVPDSTPPPQTTPDNAPNTPNSIPPPDKANAAIPLPQIAPTVNTHDSIAPSERADTAPTETTPDNAPNTPSSIPPPDKANAAIPLPQIADATGNMPNSIAPSERADTAPTETTPDNAPNTPNSIPPPDKANAAVPPPHIEEDATGNMPNSIAPSERATPPLPNPSLTTTPALLDKTQPKELQTPRKRNANHGAQGSMVLNVSTPTEDKTDEIIIHQRAETPPASKKSAISDSNSDSSKENTKPKHSNRDSKKRKQDEETNVTKIAKKRKHSDSNAPSPSTQPARSNPTVHNPKKRKENSRATETPKKNASTPKHPPSNKNSEKAGTPQSSMPPRKPVNIKNTALYNQMFRTSTPSMKKK